jgi:hypothetical protein
MPGVHPTECRALKSDSIAHPRWRDGRPTLCSILSWSRGASLPRFCRQAGLRSSERLVPEGTAPLSPGFSWATSAPSRPSPHRNSVARRATRTVPEPAERDLLVPNFVRPNDVPTRSQTRQACCAGTRMKCARRRKSLGWKRTLASASGSLARTILTTISIVNECSSHNLC